MVYVLKRVCIYIYIGFPNRFLILWNLRFDLILGYSICCNWTFDVLCLMRHGYHVGCDVFRIVWTTRCLSDTCCRMFLYEKIIQNQRIEYSSYMECQLSWQTGQSFVAFWLKQVLNKWQTSQPINHDGMDFTFRMYNMSSLWSGSKIRVPAKLAAAWELWRFLVWWGCLGNVRSVWNIRKTLV